MEIGERIRTLRNDLKLTQAAFGEKIDVKGGVVSAWEKGTAKVPYGRVLMICEKYDVNEEWLSTGVGTRQKQKQSHKSLQENVEAYIFAFLDQAPQGTQREAVAICRAVLARYGERARDAQVY